MNSEQMKDRTMEFALRVIRLVRALPRSTDGEVIGKQVCKSGTSVGANYRAACRARSKAEFIAKIGIVIEEADETIYWLELVVRSELLKETRVRALLKEADEITAILTASRKTAESRTDRRKGRAAR